MTMQPDKKAQGNEKLRQILRKWKEIKQKMSIAQWSKQMKSEKIRKNDEKCRRLRANSANWDKNGGKIFDFFWFWSDLLASHRQINTKSPVQRKWKDEMLITFCRLKSKSLMNSSIFKLNLIVEIQYQVRLRYISN